MTRGRLKALAITPQHTQKYVANHWIEPVGVGAFKRPKDDVTWQGALWSLQTQLNLKVHVGGLTALSADGSSHYLRLGREQVFLFSAPGVTLPAWFRSHDWQANLHHAQTKILPPDTGLRETAFDRLPLLSSAPERAALEVLHLAPKHVDLMEAYQTIESLRALRPKIMQSLLQACSSIKVKRLFLFMAEKAKLPVMAHLAIQELDLGTGDRAITPGGAYASKYGLILPRELVARE